MTSVSVIIIKPLVYYLESIGISKESLFKELSMNSDILEDPDKRFSDSELDSIHSATYKLSNDRSIGLKIGSGFSFNSLGLLGYFMENSETGGDVFKKLVEYEAIIGNGVSTTLEFDRDSFLVIEESRKTCSVVALQICMETVISQVLAGVRMLSFKENNPVEVHFAFPEPSDLSVYADYFKCPVYFNADQNSIRLKNDILTQKLPIYDKQMDDYFLNLVGKELEHLYSKETFSSKVGLLVLKKYPFGNVDTEQISADFCLSVRTFQRRLKDENTTFKSILDGIKKSIALNFVSSKKMALSEISYILGFSEISSFHRTFKRWTGQTPKFYRDSFA